MNQPRLLLAIAALAAAAAAQSPSTFAPETDFLAKNVFGQMPWKELGPVACGGRIVDIAVHPQNSSVFWVAAATGGLWKTSNHGISFAPQFQDAYTTSIGAIAVAPSNGDVLFLGTGEANNQRSSYWGNGVYKSTDGGKTFAHVGLDGTDHIGRIAVHPKNADIVFVAALGALYSGNETRGLYRSKDGGATWTAQKQLGPDVGFVDVAIDPQNPDVVYAASYERRRRAWNFTEGGEGSRLWKSTDGGDSFEKLGGGLPSGSLGRIGIGLFAHDPNILYATIENLNPAGAPPPPETKPAGDEKDDKEKKAPDADGEGGNKAELPPPTANEPTAEELADPLAMALRDADSEAQDPERRPRARIVGGEIWRSDDAGASWKKTNKTPIGGNPGYYYGQIRVDPNNADVVYVPSVQCYRSKDGGKTFGSAGSGEGRGGRTEDFARSLHSDHHALWIDSKNSNHALLGNDGGLAITWDGGANWDFVGRLPIAQYYAIAVDNRDDYRIYGGLQDNGSFGFPSRGATAAGIAASDAYRINGGDGFYCAVDPDNPDIVYSESQFGGISRRNLHTGQTKGIRPASPKGSPALRTNWMAPFAISPHSGATLYFGTQYVHRSLNRGDSWTTISPDLTSNDAEKKKGNVPHCTITTLAESPKAAGWLWVGTDDGKVWTCKDGGNRWLDLTDRFPAAVRGLWVSRVDCSPFEADTALVAFTGYREDLRAPFLFRTDDGGETFTAIANDLPAEPINVARFHPRNRHCLLVGTEFSVYVSVNDGGNFNKLGSNLPSVPVHDLLVHGKLAHVIAGTHGRGIWALDASALEVLDETVLAEDFRVLPPSDGTVLRSQFNGGSVGARSWSATNPFTAPAFHWYLRADAEAKVKVEVLDAAGKVLWTHNGDDKSGYHEIAWVPAGGGRRGGGGGGGGEPPANGPRGQASESGNSESPPAATPPDAAAADRPAGQNPQGQGQGGGRGRRGGQGQGGQGQGGQRQGGQRQGGQGQGGQGQGGMNFGGFPGFGGRQAMRPGQYAVRVSLGERSTTLPFTVHDRRPARSSASVPGVGDLSEVTVDEELSEEEQEEREQAEQEAEAEREAQHRRGR